MHSILKEEESMKTEVLSSAKNKSHKSYFYEGMKLYRQGLYFKNCKPAMIQSRKRGSKIHANETVSNVKRFASRIADFASDGVKIPSMRIGLAA